VSGGGVRAAGSDLSCSDVRMMLSSFLDGEGDDLQRARIERHVRRCPRCREFELFVRRSSRTLRTQSSAGQVVEVPLEPSAAALALEVRRTLAFDAPQRRGARRSSLGTAAVAAALSLGILIGGLGVWTLSQGDTPEILAREGSHSLPRVVAARTLDPGAVAGADVSILTAWIPPRRIENTFDEKAMYWATPMSHFERLHYRPEQL